MTIKDIIAKYNLPKNTVGVQVSPCLGITSYVRRVVRSYFKDVKVMYVDGNIELSIPRQENIEDDTVSALTIPKDYWIINVDNKRLIITTEDHLDSAINVTDPV